jgi:hypothetical protein
MNTNQADTKTNDELVGYTLTTGDRVTTPGKFEGLHASFVLAYNAYLSGEADSKYVDRDGVELYVTTTVVEWNDWPRLVSFYEDEFGFVMPYDDGSLLTFDAVQSISSGTRSALEDQSWADSARRYTLGVVIDHLTTAPSVLKFRTGFGDLAGDIVEVSNSWDWSNGHLFWVLARDSAVVFTDDPSLALEYAKTGGYPFVREYRTERIVKPHTVNWELNYHDVMTENYFSELAPWYRELLLALVKSDDIN